MTTFFLHALRSRLLTTTVQAIIIGHNEVVKPLLCTTMIPATLFSLLLLPLVASNPTHRREVPAHFHLSRRSTEARGPEHLANAADNLRVKYNYQPVRPGRKRAGNTAAVPITDQVRHRHTWHFVHK